MAIVYRTDGAWGPGKGVNLTPPEVDGNFYDLDGKINYLQDNPPEAITPIAINIEGGLFTMDMSDGSTLGPIVMAMPVPQWRGDWQPAMPYLEMDFFVAPDGGMGAVMISHTSAATFDWAALDPDSGLPVYQEIVGASGTTAGIGDLIDVAIAGSAANDLLVYNAAASLWQNRTPSYTATTVLPPFTGSTGSTAGQAGMVPAPAAGDVTAGKVLGAGGAWIVPPGGTGSGSLAGLSDVAIVSPINLSLLQYSSVDGKWHNQTLATLGAGTVTSITTSGGVSGGPITGTGNISLTPIANQTLLANVTGSPAAAAEVSLSTLLDSVLGPARGSVMWRSASGWVALTAGTAGQFLQTGGTVGDVTWGTPSGAGTVTQVNSGTGLTGGPITASGTVSLATVGTDQVLANISGSTAAPTGTALTLLLDHALGATQGMVLYRGASAWAALPAGASGAVLTSGGAAANPSWVTGSGAGTVTQVNTGTGLIGGPITGTGTISFATIANQTLLANISGATAAPAASNMSAILDAVFSATRGAVLYRGAAGWAALGPGTGGNVLTTGGAGADPAWAAAAGGASIATSDTPPSSPADGDAWWDSAGGQLYIWYDDGTSSQWVPSSNQPGPAGAAANITGLTSGQIGIAGSATSITSSIPLPLGIAQGGTNSTTAPAALTALGAVAKAGDTMTGTLTLNHPGGNSVVVNTPVSTDAHIQFHNGTTSDWIVGAQGFSSPGEFWVYNNKALTLPLKIDQASLATFAGNVNVNNTTNPTLALTNSTSTPASMGCINSSSVFFIAKLDSSLAYTGTLATWDASGNITVAGATATKPGGGTWTAPSDLRLKDKESILPYTRGLDALNQLQPITYEYNDIADMPTDVRFHGLVADDVKLIMPEAIGCAMLGRRPAGEGDSGDAGDEYLTFDQTPLLYALINAVKELSTKVAALEAAK